MGMLAGSRRRVKRPGYWAELLAAARRLAFSDKAQRWLDGARDSYRVMARFDGPEALVRFLHDPTGNLDEKEGVYRALVAQFQASPQFSSEPFSILWIGLNPGLDRAFRAEVRVRRKATDSADDAAGEFLGAFLELLNRLDLERVRRIPATLVRGTARDVARRNRNEVGVRFVKIEDVPEEEEALQVQPPEFSELGLPPSRTDDDEHTAACELIREADPRAVALATEVWLHDGKAMVAAGRRRISPHAVRKRLRATRARVAQALERRGMGPRAAATLRS